MIPTFDVALAKSYKDHENKVWNSDGTPNGIWFASRKLDGCRCIAIKEKDAVILVPKHQEYYSLTLDQLQKTLHTPIIIDGRNVWNRHQAHEKGFTFRGVGLPR